MGSRLNRREEAKRDRTANDDKNEVERDV
jgi:hypothetical protein